MLASKESWNSAWYPYHPYQNTLTTTAIISFGAHHPYPCCRAIFWEEEAHEVSGCPFQESLPWISSSREGEDTWWEAMWSPSQADKTGLGSRYLGIMCKEHFLLLLKLSAT